MYTTPQQRIRIGGYGGAEVQAENDSVTGRYCLGAVTALNRAERKALIVGR